MSNSNNVPHFYNNTVNIPSPTRTLTPLAMNIVREAAFLASRSRLADGPVAVGEGVTSTMVGSMFGGSKIGFMGATGSPVAS